MCQVSDFDDRGEDLVEALVSIDQLELLAMVDRQRKSRRTKRDDSRGAACSDSPGGLSA